ncbi:MAG: hypothetical protein KOO60_08415 [Gemmatimonadales bacterium]|nr:hypothetical protein [Gemmatimonadales bacterium]
MLSVAMLLSLAISFFPGGVLAQDAEDLQNYLDRTEELLLWARDLVGETENMRARRVLKEAGDLHERSLRLTAEGRPLLARGVARRARSAVWLAVKSAREALNFEERVRIRAERFRDLHGQLLDRARDSQNERAVELLGKAESQAQRAREHYLQGDPRLAFEQLNNAEQLLRSARRLLDEGGSPDRLDQDLERTRMLMEQTREMLGDNPEPSCGQLLAEAFQALERARENLAQGQPVRARQMADMARKLARQAAEQSGLEPGIESVRRQIERFDNRSALLEERIREAESRPATKAYQRALEHRQRTSESLDQGESAAALRQIRAAHQMLDQAEKLIR